MPPVLSPPVPAPPAEPTWWDRTEQVLLDNWTGILGAVVLVTGVGFLGVYTALRMPPPARFAMICAFAAALLGGHYYLREKAFAARLHGWLQSSAAAIFLFACIGAVSVPGLQWVAVPFSYALLLVGVSANLWLAWNTSQQAVATLHGVLSLVALTVLPPTLLTLGAATAVTAFSIGITWRQRWKYQLLLSIASFFAFHQFWHYHLAAPAVGAQRIGAMTLVILVGAAAAVVQYRRVYAHAGFDPLLFAAHVLNWTCLGINLYQYSTGSIWKTIPLGFGALFTFGVARQARRLGIRWLYRTDSIISLVLALFTAFSLQGWHATGSLVLLFMLLETLLIGFVMAREGETVVFRVAASGALLAGLGLLLLNLAQLPTYSAVELQRNAVLLLLAGGIGAGYFRLVQEQLLSDNDELTSSRQLHQSFGGVVGALYLGTAALLLRALFGLPHPPVAGLIASAAGAAGAVFALAWWLRPAGNWFRTLHLLGGQVLLVTALLGLHEAGLSWSATATLTWLESLLLAVALTRATEGIAGRAVLAGALLSGGWLLLTAANVSHHSGFELHRDAALLLLAGVAGTAAYSVLGKWRSRSEEDLEPSDEQLLTGTGILVGVLLAGVAGLLGRALFGVENPPVGALLGGGVAAAGVVFGLTWWVRATPGWFRNQLLLLGQLLLVVTTLGLHETGLTWPTTVTLLYLEVLAMTLVLAWLREALPYRVVLYSGLLLTLVLPVVAYRPSPDMLPASRRALLLLLAALGATGTLAGLQRLGAPAFDELTLSYAPPYRLRLLGFATGVLLLVGFGLVYDHVRAAWIAGGVGVGWLLLRRARPLPGLWEGLLLAVAGADVLQWGHVLPADRNAGTLPTVAYLLPLLAPLVAGLTASWWPESARHLRWPWLYLLGLHLTVGAWAALAPHSRAWPVLVWLALAVGFAMAARAVRRHWPEPESLARAGAPDRHLLHLTLGLLTLALVVHFGELVPSETQLLGTPARRLTAAALLLVLGGLAWSPPAAIDLQSRAWVKVQPLLPEATLLVLTFTIGREARVAWETLAWIALAFGLSVGGRYLPEHLRRVQAYGLLYFWLTVLWSSYVALRYLTPGHLLSEAWLTTAVAVALLFAYTAAALARATAEPLAVEWPPALAFAEPLGTLTRRQLVLALLYPAFVALTVLLVRSFDRSILTVLLMLEVVGLFVSSLALRRPDLRYAALLGVAVCLVRLVFFDLSQRGTITRAVVFILMGLLLLGMNALYARFKDRFAPDSAESEPDPEQE